MVLDAKSLSYLLKNGADPNALNYSGFTPAHLAVDRDVTEILGVLKCLEKYHVDFTIRNCNNETPLMSLVYASVSKQFDHLKCVKYLIRQTLLHMSRKEDLRTVVIEPTLETLLKLFHEPLVSYYQKCVSEIVEMKADIVLHDISVLEIVHMEGSIDEIGTRISRALIINHILQQLAKNAYPVFSDILADLLSRSHLEASLNQVRISSMLQGVVDVICEEIEKLKWEFPTPIQQEAIPIALQGRDVIAYAETGSGKTGAFAIPVLQFLIKDPQRFFALVLTPTRELAFQIAQQFEALGSNLGVKTAVIVGGMDLEAQRLELTKKPHIIIATPGRLVDHLQNLKGFCLSVVKFLVIDEADKMLDEDFKEDVDKILQMLPQERNTYLYSATMTEKLEKLKRASLKNPVKIEVSTKYQTVETLQQYYLFIPEKYKDVYLVHILNELPGKSIIVFCATCANAERVASTLNNLGIRAIHLHGKLSQARRRDALKTFKAKQISILISTDLANRGLDIPHVDVIINLDIPLNAKEYIHRVGRAARAGRTGKAITFVTQFEIPRYQEIEQMIEKELPLYPSKHDEVMVLWDRVKEAQLAVKEMEEPEGNDNKRKHDDDDDNNTKESKGNKRSKKKNKKKLKKHKKK